MHLLFWLSLFPFATVWMGENHNAPMPSAAYGVVLLMAALAYYILQARIVGSSGRDSVLGRAIGTDWKGKLSPVFYLLAIPAALLSPWISSLLYIVVALWWIVPDRRIERTLAAMKPDAH